MMIESTYKTMTLEHLGDNSNVADLAAFQRACRLRNRVEDETVQETTDAMWGQGDFLKRVMELVDYNSDEAEAMTEEERDDYAEAIRSGDYDR